MKHSLVNRYKEPSPIGVWSHHPCPGVLVLGLTCCSVRVHRYLCHVARASQWRACLRDKQNLCCPQLDAALPLWTGTALVPHWEGVAPTPHANDIMLTAHHITKDHELWIELALWSLWITTCLAYHTWLTVLFLRLFRIWFLAIAKFDHCALWLTNWLLAKVLVIQ